ncbi:BQ2448_7688 [Microbotryum intermedium]|uniref:BQ2448_7688 protein n=1 Tax=Microbotryum intermedium TaxID=269621 RepID=A0A238FPG0_9BASI|nr:BQ2448_7688 [Microbotryum intermedium]
MIAIAAVPAPTPVCAQSKFYNVATKQCANCQAGVKSCSNATTATSCLRNYYLSGNSCVTSCPAGSWADASSFKCVACTDTDAATCSQAVPGAITCKTKYAYKGACVAPCPNNFRMEPSSVAVTFAQHYQFVGSNHKPLFGSDRTCMQCSDPDAVDCTSIASVSCLTKLLSNGKCVDTCTDPKTFADTTWHTCSPCPADATSCDSKGLALGCATKFLSLGACVDSCPTNSYTNLAAKTCSACADGVTACSASGDLSWSVTESTDPDTPGASADHVPTFSMPTHSGNTITGVQLFLDSLKSKCVASASCSPKFFGNTVTKKCEKCAVDGALTCGPATVALTCGTNAAGAPTFLTTAGSCVTSCPSGFYGQSGKCLPCGANALTCDTKGAAITCAANTYVSAGACVTVCPTRTFADNTLGTCVACGTGALTCSSPTIAKTCGLDQYNNQLYLLNGRCAPASACPTWSFPDPSSQKCIQCTSLFPGSLTCNAKGALSCGQTSGGKQLFLTLTQNCVEAAQCVVGTYPDTSRGECVACSDGVTSCTGLGASQALTCGTSSQNVLLFFDPSTSCVSQCPTKSYPVPSSSSCVKCDDGDDACTGNGDGTALVCGINSLGRQTYLSPTNDCVEASKCGQIGAYYPDDSLKACVSCDEGELACTADGFGAATKCGKLPATGEQLYLFQGDCYTGPNCPQGTFVNGADNTCTSCPAGVLLCDAIDNANLCAPSLNGQTLFMNAGSCVTTDKCPLGTYGKPGPFVCASCLELDSHAKQCDINNRATLCFPGWWARLSDGVCVTRSGCDSSFYINDGPRTCTPCERIQHMSTTCTATQATSCKPGSYLLNGVCLSSCPVPGYFQEDASWSCVPCGSLFAHATMCDRSSLYACEGGWAVTRDANNNRVCTSNCDPGLQYVIAGSFVTQNAGNYDSDIRAKVPFNVQGCYPCSQKFGEFAFTCTENDLGTW